MSENQEPPNSPDPDETPATQPRTRWQDRVWSFRAMLAVALASLLIGGLGGAAITAVAGGDDVRRELRMGPWSPGGDGPPGWHHRGPRGFDGEGPRWP